MNISTTPPTPNTRVSASLSDDGKFLVMRYVNDGGADLVTLQILGMAVEPTARVWQIHSDDLHADNTPGNPLNVAPTYSEVDISSGALNLPSSSYTIVLFTSK